MTKLSSVTLLALLAAPAVAFAQPSVEPVVPPPVPAPPAPSAPVRPAPQTHDWNDVSHINGQVVKVGEQNEYIKKTPRKTIISSNPIGWITGFYGISLSHAVSEQIALRADANYIDPIDDEGTQLWELGAGVPLYLKRAYHGPFLEPGFIVRGQKETDWSGTIDANGNWMDESTTYTKLVGGPQVLLGWQWLWDSGFSLAVAAGAGRDVLVERRDTDYEPDTLFFNGYFRVGYGF